MATRWFGPRPIRQLSEGPFSSWPNGIFRHGSCGCCKCGGFYSESSSFDNDELFNRYSAYKNGLRIKLVIADVPDGWQVEIDKINTDVTGLSSINGTWYLTVNRTQYGCIWSADDRDEFFVEHRLYETELNLYDYYVDMRIQVGSQSSRVANTFFGRLDCLLYYDSPEYKANDPYFPIFDQHPFIGLEFVPNLAQYGLATYPVGVEANVSTIAWDANRLPDVISGTLKYFLTQSAGLAQQPDVFTNPNWIGVDAFYDVANDEFKTAGTFTAEIERL